MVALEAVSSTSSRSRHDVRGAHGSVTRNEETGEKRVLTERCISLGSGGVAGFGSLSIECVGHVMDFLTLQESARLKVSHRALLECEELPLARRFRSFCGACDQCREQDEHLCRMTTGLRVETHQQAMYKSLFEWSGDQLVELRVASYDVLGDALLTNSVVDKSLAALQVLDLARCKNVSTNGFTRIASLCGNLRELQIREMNVSSDLLIELLTRNRFSLRKVCFQGCHLLEGRVVQALGQLCGDQLDQLVLWGCHNVDNESLIQAVASCRKLTKLTLRYCHKVNDSVVIAIADHLDRLQQLDLQYCYRVTDQSVLAICQQLVFMTKLNLSQCFRLTDASVECLVKRLAFLEELRLFGCTKLSADALELLTEALPRVAFVGVRPPTKAASSTSVVSSSSSSSPSSSLSLSSSLKLRNAVRPFLQQARVLKKHCPIAVVA